MGITIMGATETVTAKVPRETKETLNRHGVNDTDVLYLAGRHGLSFYDASYLWAAMNGGYTRVTDVLKLAREASSDGVDVLGADAIG